MSKYQKEILTIINESHTHLTANDIFEIIKKKEPKIVLASIYNNINALLAKELIRKVSIEGQIDRYDKIIKHDHLVCKKCGKLIDINFKDLSSSLAKQANINILGYDLKAFIICDECQKKGQK